MNMKANAVVAEPVSTAVTEPRQSGDTLTASAPLPPVAQHAEQGAHARIAARHALVEKSRRYLVRVAALIMAVVLWHLASTYDFNLFVNFEHVPEPALVGQALMAELSGSEFYLHIAHSLKRIAIAYGLA